MPHPRRVFVFAARVGRPSSQNHAGAVLVSVLDDDESVRESLPDLIREFGFIARTFSSPEEFLTSDSVGRTRCLILDIAMCLLRQGAVEYLFKPFSDTALLEALNTALFFNNAVPWFQA